MKKLRQDPKAEELSSQVDVGMMLGTSLHSHLSAVLMRSVSSTECLSTNVFVDAKIRPIAGVDHPRAHAPARAVILPARTGPCDGAL